MKTSILRSYEDVLQAKINALKSAVSVIEVAIRAEWTIKFVGDRFEFQRHNGEVHRTQSLDKIPAAVQEWFDSLPVPD